MHNYDNTQNKNSSESGVDPGFSWGGGGGAKDYVQAIGTHITIANPKAPHGRGSGPA